MAIRHALSPLTRHAGVTAAFSMSPCLLCSAGLLVQARLSLSEDQNRTTRASTGTNKVPLFQPNGPNAAWWCLKYVPPCLFWNANSELQCSSGQEFRPSSWGSATPRKVPPELRAKAKLRPLHSPEDPKTRTGSARPKSQQQFLI